jgi:hypothetical protein
MSHSIQMNTMNNFSGLQGKLNELNSKVRIKSHDKYNQINIEINVLYSKFLPFLLRKGRSASIENRKSGNEFTVVSLFKNRENERACARVKGQEKLALLLHQWLDKRLSFEEMAAQFDDFEYAKPFPIKNLGRNREIEWQRIKTHLFFLYVVEWENKKAYAAYEELLTAIKQREELKTYYPTLSHQWLRFKSVKEDYLSGYLMVTGKNEAKRFYVSSAFSFDSSDSIEKLLTDDVEVAIDFYISKALITNNGN